MRMYEIIKTKRDKKQLSQKQINYFIENYIKGKIEDYQVAALLMAIYLNGMNDEETTYLTLAMANSGDIMDLSNISGITVDKHSTGGVGDKTTLIVAPCMAALGYKVAKMSGRGLGHTGGTVDKLESIPGYRTELSNIEFIDSVNKIGIAVVGQTGNLTPADKKIYALRDVTATVDSLPLIVSSIMSKKIAAGSKNIVLDVKTGSGSFTPKLEDAILLAEKMVQVGKSTNRNVAALVTNMDIPLGKAIGNSIEIKEVCEVLNGKGPADLKKICLELTATLVHISSGISLEQCRRDVKEVLKTKEAWKKFRQLVSNQGGDVSYLDNPDLFEKSAYTHEVKAENSGYIDAMDTSVIGEISLLLGAGREKKEDIIDYSAGIYLHKKVGDFVEKGEILASLYTNKKEILEETDDLYKQAITYSENKPNQQKLVYLTVK